MSIPSTTSIKNIQRRLILILVRAYLTVAVIGMVAMIGLIVFEISSNTGNNPFYRSPNATILEAYYVGHGSWSGVESIVSEGQNPESRLLRLDWQRSILLDANGNVVMSFGQQPSMPMAEMMNPMEFDQMPLMVNRKTIGTLIVEKQNIPHPVRLTLGALYPIFILGFPLILLTVIIGVLLMRRVVNPLAEVIAAAESVAAGNFGTRIKLKKSQDDLYALSAHFNNMTEALERNDNERRAMLADIAHELRTPLSVLRGRLEGIIDGIYPSNEINIAQALEETYLVERLVEDLRLLTLAESRQLHFELKEIDLVELLNKTINVFDPQATAKKVGISLKTTEEKLIALVDPQRLEQVVGNLIGNSLRYVSSGGKIELEINHAGAFVEIKISDTGPGVKEEDLPYIFERFWRGEKSRARVSGGAGLGLAISKQLVEAQNGRITATNRAEGGLQVTVTLPLKK